MSKAASSIALQPRDFLLLCGLFDSRVLTISHISRLYFEGRDEAGKKRLQKLKAAGFISQRARRADDPSALFLARKGFEVPAEAGHLSQSPQISRSSLRRPAQRTAFTRRHDVAV